MIRLFLLVFLLYLARKLWVVLKRRVTLATGRPPEKTLKGEDMVQDPHCGVYLPRGDALAATVGGKRRHFCSEGCRDAFARRK